MRLSASAHKMQFRKLMRTRNDPLKEMVWSRDKLPNGTIPCVWCKAELPKKRFTLEHLKPLALGGTSDLSNLAAACQKCNNERPCTDETKSLRQQ